NLDRGAAQAAGVIVFAHAGLDRRGCSDPCRRLAPEDNGHRTVTTFLPVPPDDLLSVMMLQHPKTQPSLPLNAGAVSAYIDPAALWIARNHHVRCSDVAAAIQLVPLRRGEFFQIDVFAFDHILRDRPPRHFHWRKILETPALVARCF